MSQQPWGDIPLFREIQRILAASQGPINKELAKQVAVAIATQEGDSRPGPEALTSFEDAVRDVEAPTSGYARLPLEEPARLKLLTRADWVTESLDAWGWLFEHLARRFSQHMGAVEPDDQTGPLAATLSQVSPLLIGIQVGTLLGQLAKDVTSRFDYPIPRDDDGRLFFVEPNVRKVAADYGFGVDAFARWLAVHSVARHLVVANTAWANRYFRSLLVEIIDAMEIDIGDLERRMAELQSGGLESFQEGLQDAGGLPLVHTERHRRAAARLAAFVAVFEGYALHVAGSVTSEIVPSASQIDEGMTRRSITPNEAEEMLAAVLGVSFDRDLEAAGRTFCAAVVKLRGINSLNRIWAAPDNLPAYDEIKDPFGWMERVLDDDAD